jgi:hypothetical protein
LKAASVDWLRGQFVRGKKASFELDESARESLQRMFGRDVSRGVQAIWFGETFIDGPPGLKKNAEK